ncbi:MAG: carboxypeptidase-like regulatory domain-containing protein [Acidobacteriota bacterium]|nr:carboxypeptidase-like regulatory domain-containing protein [Acidobacteriota bacterium]
MRRRSLAVFRGIVLALFCVILHARQAPPAAPGIKLFRIAGVVVRHGTNQPLRRVQVTISLNDHPDKRASVTTSDDGQFTFTDVPQGKFTLLAESHGRLQTYQQDEQYSTGIVTGPGFDSEHIVFSLLAPTGIKVRVLDEEGEPVRSAQVWLFRKKITAGWSQIELAQQGNTDSEGISSLAHLQPDTYYVAADARPWYAQQAGVVSGPVTPNGPPAELDVAYAITYYPGSQDPAAAAPVEIPEGTTAEVQIALRAVPAAHISLAGTAEHSDDVQEQRAPMMAAVEAIGPGGIRLQASGSVFSFMGSAGEISGVAPGNYIVSLSQPGGRPAARNRQVFGQLAVSAGEDTKVGRPDFTSTGVSGHLIWEGREPLGELVIWLVQPANGQSAYCRVDHDRSFDCSANGRVGSFAPGRYEVRLANNENLYIKSIAVKGGALVSGLVDVREGSSLQLSIVVAKGVTKLNGIALKNGVPLSGAMILAVPESREEGLEIPRDQSDSDGTFTLQDVHPGRYLLLAIDNGHALEYRNLKIIEPYLAQAQVVEISSAAPSTPVRVVVQGRR